MTLKEKLQTNLKDAFKKGDKDVLGTLRLVLASIQNKEIELGKKESGLPDEETQNVIRKELKKRKDSIEAYTKAERTDLKEKEQKEFDILKDYLPPELSDEEIKKIIKEAIKETGAESQKDFGKVMGNAMVKLKGKTSGDRVSEIVKELLNG